MSDPIPSSRLPFHGEFFERAGRFAKDTFVMIPELESIAVVPSWEVPVERLPAGIIVGREGPLKHPAEIMHMGQQLHSVLRQVMDMSGASLKAVDAYAAKLAEEIRDRQQQLETLQKLRDQHTP